MSLEPRRRLELAWAGLDSEPVSGRGRMRVLDLPVETPRGPLVAAVDREGHRHLLIPVDSGRRLRREPAGPTLVLSRHPLEDDDTYQVYADLGCARPDLNDLFSLMCAEILETVAALPQRPVKGLYRALDRWKDLFRAAEGPLSEERLAGLHAELLVLARLLEHDEGAHRLWRGPEGHHHDFSGPRCAVEVKTTTGPDGRRARIHGLRQLQAPDEGALWLACLRLERAPAHRGEGFLELIERLLGLCDDENALLNRLAAAGYRPADAPLYERRRFQPAEEHWYEVDEAFPKLTVGELSIPEPPAAVHEVAYTLDLTGQTHLPADSDPVARHLRAMIREIA